MPNHTRLYRRGATYYHRAAIPLDIKESYPKTEETFSLKTKDYQEALKRVRETGVRVDRGFEAHRRELAALSLPPVDELSDEQIQHIRDVYYAFRLEEDDDIRLDGFYDAEEPTPDLPLASFDEFAELNNTLDDINRGDYA